MGEFDWRRTDDDGKKSKINRNLCEIKLNINLWIKERTVDDWTHFNSIAQITNWPSAIQSKNISLFSIDDFVFRRHSINDDVDPNFKLVSIETLFGRFDQKRESNSSCNRNNRFVLSSSSIIATETVAQILLRRKTKKRNIFLTRLTRQLFFCIYFRFVVVLNAVNLFLKCYWFTAVWLIAFGNCVSLISSGFDRYGRMCALWSDENTTEFRLIIQEFIHVISTTEINSDD